MKIGILQTGLPPADLGARFGDYPTMIGALLGAGFTHETIDVVAGTPPADPGAYGAYVITGSTAGVYEDLPWIAPLMDFLRAVRGRAPLVGICFGHQIMAQAFGGQVVKSPKGWGVGLQRYAVTPHAPRLDAAQVAIPASHQDQVVVPPPGAVVTLASDFTPYAGLAYDDGMAISFQAHPEFDPAFAAALIEARRGTRFDDEAADRAIASLSQPNDRDRVGGWMRRFLAR